MEGKPSPAPAAASASTRTRTPARVMPDPPADPFTDIDTKSELNMKPFTLQFADPDDELLWQAWRWKLSRRIKLWSIIFLLAFTTALSFEYESSVYKSNAVMLLVFFLGRLLPLLVLGALVFMQHKVAIKHWDIVAVTALLIIAISIYIDTFLCAKIGSFIGYQCIALTGDERLPWPSTVAVTVLPFLAAIGLHISWIATFAFGLLSFFAFVGLNLVFATQDAVATIVIAAVGSTVVASVARLISDLELRISFKREAATKRKLTSVIGTSLARVVLQEQQQRFAEVLKRVDACFLEASADGIIYWLSPAARTLFAVEPDELIRSDFFRTLHSEDAQQVKASVAQLIQRGNDAALSSGRTGGVALGSGAYGSALAADPQLHRRLVYRRRREKDYLWVEAEAYAIVRKPTLIPGVSTPTQPGETTVLFVERDISAEKRRAAPAEVSAGQIPASTDAIHGPGSTEQDGAKAGDAGGNATKGAQPAAATTSAASTVSYDPFFERTMFTALGSTTLLMQGARSLLNSYVTDSGEVADEVEVAKRYVECAHTTLVDTLGIARYRSQHLPLLTAQEFSLKPVLQNACLLAERVNWKRGSSPRIITNIDEHIPENIGLDKHMTELVLALALFVARSISVEGGVTLNVHLADVATGEISHTIKQSTGQQNREQTELALRFSVIFDASRVGGMGQLAAALAADPLRDNRLFAPSRTVNDMSAVFETSAGLPAFWCGFPLLRHAVLCMGGVISLGTGASPPSTSPSDSDGSAVVMVLDMPLAASPRPIVPGPTLADMSMIASIIAECAVDHIPPIQIPAAVRPTTVGAAAPGDTSLAPPAVSIPAAMVDTKAAPGVPQLQMHVLFVDDEAVNRRLGGRMLQRLGCTYVLLEDGDQVAAALKDAPRPFDVILMDIMMQRSDGAAVCQELREEGVNLAIVAMTGHTSVRDVQRFMTAGFDVVLPKPFDIWAMRKALIEGHARRARINANAGQANEGATAGSGVPAW